MPGLASYLFTLCSALALSLAWFVPGTELCVVFGWVAAFGIASLPRSAQPFRQAFLFSILIHALSFHWLFSTISDFGGFSTLPALGIFLFFIAGSSLLFLLYVFLAKRLLQALPFSPFCVPLAWTVSEAFAPKIFPWLLGHTQLALIPVSQIATLGSALLVSFFMLLSVELLFLLARRDVQEKLRKSVIPAALLISLLAYGLFQQLSWQEPQVPRLRTQLVQGNISLHDKHAREKMLQNIQKYVELSEKFSDAADLVLWPETVVMGFLPEDPKLSKYDFRAEFLSQLWKTKFASNPPALAFGALSYNENKDTFNSVYLLRPSLELERPYHKQLLMPFGEYTPLGETLPFLKEINATAADFARGEGPEIFSIKKFDTDFKLASLICYEDVAPELSRQAVLEGANILANFTNDAWFGNSAAPYQHNLIASFRAVENRRFLLRATNTGLTAIVDPFGRTLSQLETFKESAISYDIYPVEAKTLYTKWAGSRFSYVAVFIVLCIILSGSRRNG